MFSGKEFIQWRDYISGHCGIYFDDAKAYLLQGKLSALLPETNSADLNELYAKLIQGSIPGLREKIVESLTIHETLWFRDAKPYHAIELAIIPSLYQEIYLKKSLKIKIWSAACSSGQEPYSLAMLLHKFCLGKGVDPSDVFEILATDVSRKIIDAAKEGRYNFLSISRGLSEELKNRFFRSDGKSWVINDSLKKLVKFRQLNLKDNFSFLGHQDIILCRNVCIYFNDAFKKKILEQMASLLKPGGYLFLGATESLLGYNSDFQMMLHDGTIFYKCS